MVNQTELKYLRLLSIVLLLGTFLNPPYFYFQVMNWVVSGTSLLTAAKLNQSKSIKSKWLFILMAIVFNPFAPLYLTANLWKVTDILMAILFLFSFRFLKK